MEGPGADSEEKHEPASDIYTALMDSLKVLDQKWPIREARISDARSDGHRFFSASSRNSSGTEREMPSATEP
jgi:hypothetical protein